MGYPHNIFPISPRKHKKNIDIFLFENCVLSGGYGVVNKEVMVSCMNEQADLGRRYQNTVSSYRVLLFP